MDSQWIVFKIYWTLQPLPIKKMHNGPTTPPAGLPRWLSGKEFSCDAQDAGSIPGSGRSPRKGNGNPLQDSCLGNPMERGTGQIVAHWVTKELDTTY